MSTDARPGAHLCRSMTNGKLSPQGLLHDEVSVPMGVERMTWGTSAVIRSGGW